MGVPFKPHTAKVLLKGQAITEAGVTVKGLLYPLTAAQSMNTYAVVLDKGHEWLGDSSTRDLFQEGGRMIVSGRTYAIRASHAFDGIHVADHVQVLLEVDKAQL